MMGHTRMAEAWAVLNATRLAGREWGFERFLATAVDCGDRVDVPVAEGLIRIRGCRPVLVDGREEVSMPVDAGRLQAWIERAGVHRMAEAA